MQSISATIVIPLILSTLTAVVVESLNSFNFGPVYNVIIASFIILFLSLPIVYLRFIGAVFQSAGYWEVGGLWTTRWSYVKDGETIEIKDRLNVKQWGSFVFGKGQGELASNRARFRTYRYRFQGVINEEGMIEGKWQNVDPGRIYYGVLQLKVGRSCKEVEGCWVGSSSTTVHSGTWIWERQNGSHHPASVTGKSARSRV